MSRFDKRQNLDFNLFLHARFLKRRICKPRPVFNMLHYCTVRPVLKLDNRNNEHFLMVFIDYNEPFHLL